MKIKSILLSLCISALVCNEIQSNDSIIQELKSLSFVESTVITVGIAACYVIRKCIEPSENKKDTINSNLYRGINCLRIREDSKVGVDYIEYANRISE